MVKARGGKNNKTKIMLAGLTAGAVITTVRPALVAKVYAADNAFEWERQEDLDRFGGYYNSAARSADGNSLILGVRDGGENQDENSPLYLSNNNGASWENVATGIDDLVNNSWVSVDISNNGQVMVAASDYGLDRDGFNEVDGSILVSEDGGDTWTNRSPVGTDDWTSVVVSGDGSKIAAIQDDDEELHLFNTSNDTWTTVDLNNVGTLRSVSMSDNGQTILVGGENTNDYSVNLYKSTNGGANWSDISPESGGHVEFSNHDISADGSRIVLATAYWDGSDNGEVFVSQNGGGTWADVTPEDEANTPWVDAAISDDGGTVSIVAGDGGPMYISDDLGTTWNEEDPGQEYEDSNNWRAADFNGDGTRAVVVGDDNAYITVGSTPEPSNPSVSLVNPETGKAIQITTPDGTTITCHSAVKGSALSAQDGTYSYPLGLVDFCFDTDEESNAVTLTFVTDLKPSEAVIRKYNPTTKAYATISDASVTETTLEGQHALQVTYTIVDNGPLDLDPDEGEIADPVGIGVAAAQAGLASTGQSMTAYLLLASALFATGLSSVKLRNQSKR